MRHLAINGEYIMDHGRDNRIVRIKTLSDQFVVITDGTSAEQVMDRATFAESAVLNNRFRCRYLFGNWTEDGQRTVMNAQIHPPVNDDYWCIDLLAVPESAYERGWDAPDQTVA